MGVVLLSLRDVAYGSIEGLIWRRTLTFPDEQELEAKPLQYIIVHLVFTPLYAF